MVELLILVFLSVPDAMPSNWHTEEVLQSDREAHLVEKLDPRLLELVEHAEGATGEAETVINVLVGLDAPLDAESRAALVNKGLTIRSELGNVLTGSIKLKDVTSVASSPRVVKLELSGPLYPDNSTDGLEEASE